MSISRPSGRSYDQLRDVKMEIGTSRYAEGSCLIQMGHTHVLCTASVDDRTPPFLKGSNQGWVTAEYGMLPRSTASRMDREASRGKQGGRTLEIQRLIGRSLRAVTDLTKIKDFQIRIDCDVIQADGGTRTAAITGGFVALYQACQHMVAKGMIADLPFTQFVAAISCGIYEGEMVLDLDYDEDSNAIADSNFVMSEDRHLIEVQATAEKHPFARSEFLKLLDLAEKGIGELIQQQKSVLGIS